MKIVILGAGNIATHYAKAFFAEGHEISQIFNRTSANANALADVVSATSIQTIQQLDLNADLFIIAVSDDYIEEIIGQLNQDINGIVVHTSGATHLSVLEKFKNHGVIYPPQSLNKAVQADLHAIPFAIEGSSDEVESKLLALVQRISPKAMRCNSQQRLALHISAVFANNFPNLLFTIAKSILDKEKIDFDTIKPIILETAKKVQIHDPSTVQTGPAVRNDQKTINAHLDFLSYSNSITEIYQILTAFIINKHVEDDL